MIWSKIFSRKSKLLSEPVDLGILHTDLHSHLIPGIDDGSKTMKDSITLIRELWDLGYRKLITTPHIMNDYYKNTPEIILSGLDNLRAELTKQGIKMEIEAAAEYMLDDGFMDKLEAGDLLTFGNKFVLVEMSYIEEPPNLNSVFFELQTNGYQVILAHPERYNYWHHDFSKYQDLFDRNIYLQMNINSLTGWYSPESKNIAERLIENKLISFLGSDLHNQNYLRELKKSRYMPALAEIIGSAKILNSKL
ncbi:MAG: capsular biosynthesis protein [Bacteroidetes bacterium]|nr:MAG: capsular biosynthesis protein [Bacteroidota bacterium]